MSSRSRRQKCGRKANRAGNLHIERQQPGPRTTKPDLLREISAWLTKSVPLIRGIASVIHAIVELIRCFPILQNMPAVICWLHISIGKPCALTRGVFQLEAPPYASTAKN